ncbi:MAG: aminoglycoside phosphotransferase family protein [Candidatus Aenigmarchaeota archaeon]|nr:aminoglycoside phosphotransferase family protein [Candidatus Aenigmarchaeota archaeon]
MLFINLKTPIKTEKVKQVINKQWITNFFSQRVRQYWPNSKLIDVNLEIVRNFRGKFRNLALKYILTIYQAGKLKKKIIRGRIDCLHQCPLIHYQTLIYLRQHSFNRSITRPLLYYQPLNFLLYEDLAGIPLQNLLEKRRQLNVLLETTPAIIKWLKKLHSLPIKKNNIWRQHNLNYEKDERRHWLFLFRKCAPSFHQRAKEILNSLWKIRKDDSFLSSKDFSLIHSDFHWGNIIVQTSKKIGIIDLADASLGDQLEDIAKLIVQTESMFSYYAPKRQVLRDKIIKQILTNYFFSTKPRSSQLIRLYYFMTLNYLQMAAIQSLVETNKEYREKSIITLLTKAEEKLRELKKLFIIK